MSRQPLARNPRHSRLALAGLLGIGLLLTLVPSASTQKLEPGSEQYHRDFVFGVPRDATEEWALAWGGRLYDKWWQAVGGPEPKGTHSAYPATSKQKGATTWRCKECHGWDYKGAAGAYGSGARFTGIKGITGAAGLDPKKIAATLRNKPHGFTPQMIPDDALDRLALFVSKGQHDVDKFIDKSTKRANGNVDRGRKLYQNVCAVCHGFDGKLLNFGDAKNPEYVGTVATANPWETMHKIINGQPGIPMPAWRGFDLQATVDVLAYAQTLPAK